MSPLLANYVHDLSPILFELGPLKLRWYGLAYVVGVLAGYWVLRHFSRRDLWVVAEDKVSDVVTYTAVFGVFLGGRLGYVLFYLIPEKGWQHVFNDPLVIFRVWDGGMASHGGILGIFFFTLYYAWRHKLSWTGLGDGICVVAPIGIFFGRMANFINGELWGTKTDHAFGVKFPDTLLAINEVDQLNAAVNEAAFADPAVEDLLQEEGAYNILGDVTPTTFKKVVEISRDSPEVLEALGNHITPRHPSQLYEGFLEGALLFAILYFVRVKFPKLPHGILTGLFFILYALFRIGVEMVREPDSDPILGITKGQFYSIYMIVIGAVFLFWGVGQKKRPVPRKPDQNESS